MLLTFSDADAVVKCLASAVATGTLLFLSPILFGTDVNPLVIPGGFIVFSSSWLYMEAAPPKKNPTEKRDTAFTRLAEFTSVSSSSAVSNTCKI